MSIHPFSLRFTEDIVTVCLGCLGASKYICVLLGSQPVSDYWGRHPHIT